MKLLSNSGRARDVKGIKFGELPVTDQDRSVKFFLERAGLKITEDAPLSERWRWMEFEISAAETKIVLSRRPDEGLREAPTLVIVTEDIRKAYQTLKSCSKGDQFLFHKDDQFLNCESIEFFYDGEPLRLAVVF